MSETHAENGNASSERFDHLHGHAGIVGRTGAGRNTQMRRLERSGLFYGDLIVAMHEHLSVEHQESLHQVVRERVVIIDEEQARSHKPSSAKLRARRKIALLASTS